jgi:hypothetical protein
VVEVVELAQPLAETRGLAVGAGARDRVGEHGGGYDAREDIEGRLFFSEVS